jgi:hypothetical protein
MVDGFSNRVKRGGILLQTYGEGGLRTFPMVGDEAQSRLLLSPEQSSPTRSMAFLTIVQKIFRLEAFTPGVSDLVRSFHSCAYQGHLASCPSFDAMLAHTPGNWLVLTEGGPVHKFASADWSRSPQLQRNDLSSHGPFEPNRRKKSSRN